MEKGDVVVDLWADMDKPRVWFVKEVDDRGVQLQSVKLVPRGPIQESVHDKLVTRWLIVARLSKKAGR